MPPEYHLESFWTDRFKTEQHFEWLGDGQDTIIPVFREYLRSDGGNSNKPLRTLHIGAGTSTLSQHILATYQGVYGDSQIKDIIVNTDFSEQAVQQGRAMMKIKKAIRWETVDMLCWRDVVAKLLPEGRLGSNGDAFAVVVDKSTSDAISCAPNIRLNLQDQAANANLACPSIAISLARNLVPTDTWIAEPVELLALHLAALVRPQGIWVALSYSSSRFPFFNEPSSITPASLFWIVKQVIPVDAPSGQTKKGIHAPTVQHYVYILERTCL